MANTPNMDLIEPTPGVGGTPGPQWASEVNENFETIDEHDHSPGKGVPIGPSAIAINADLPFNGFSATDLLSTQYATQSSDPPMTAGIFVKNGELTYIDSAGNIVQITASGSVAGATGSISGLTSPASAVYSSVTKSFTWSYDSAKTARMASADLIVYPYDGVTAYTNSITLKVPTTLAAAYSITLPGAVPTQDGLVGMSASGVLSAGVPTGSASAPGMAFAVQLNTGFYRSGVSQLAASINGVYTASFEPGQLKMVSGTVAAPSFSFNGDPDTGFYNPGTNTLGVVCNGTRPAFFGPLGIYLMNGSAAAPSYTFDNDQNTGFYSASADNIGIATNGTLRLNIGTGTVQSLLPVAIPDATAATPGLRFTSESDTGLYHVGANQIGFAANGTDVAMISTAGISSGSASTADCIKWDVFTGTLAGSASLDLSVTGTILACVGYTFNSTGAVSFGGPMDNSGGSTGGVYFNPSLLVNDGNTQRITNVSGSTRPYKVIIYHQ